MIDLMATDVTTPRPAALRMPLQAAPIDRTSSAGAIGDAPGLEADGWFDEIFETVLPIAKQALPLIAGSI